MELIANNNVKNMVLSHLEVTNSTSSSFIEANTEIVSLEHLKEKCTIPVFAKDNETTISHFQFINETLELIKSQFPNTNPKIPDIRVSHVVKGRVPTAIGKPAKELLEHEKTIYYERCAFVIEIPEFKKVINGNELSLCVGGVRAYNQENLYSKKSLEKFKMFVGFQNKVCTNLCVSSDGFTNEIRIGSILDLNQNINNLLSNYNKDSHLKAMQTMSNYSLTENQFASLVGKTRMFQHLDKVEQQGKFLINLNDSQINNVVKDYYNCLNFKRSEDGSINMWNLYNLFTEANKSSYIDSNFERNVNCYAFVNHLVESIKNDAICWYLHN
ncbi:DUF3871 family protein [Olleya sp. 1-3]|uniref:DUF3871 family protein n=1 Tax=Olleya sp. 1-3 TaxID=2058323 RepID=UPI000C341FB5|nr:DUF3871 family protein [Olleya sp. 1-3]PKG52917.1 hypothetical protein CXF54_03850 [Olleya sp. 1-3]